MPNSELLQRFKRLRSNALVDAADEVEVPCLAVSGAGLLDPRLACLVIGLLDGACFDAVLAKLREVINGILVVLPSSKGGVPGTQL